jgi:hypothetical protein
MIQWTSKAEPIMFFMAGLPVAYLGLGYKCAIWSGVAKPSQDDSRLAFTDCNNSRLALT